MYYNYDIIEINKNIAKYRLRNFKLFYSVKACLFKGLIEYIDSLVDGYSVSSIAELKKVRKETDKPIHFVSPLIRDQEICEINKYADSVSFNSLEQHKRYNFYVSSRLKKFLRINPEISTIKDKRYNPCRKFSKLGIPLDELRQYLDNEKNYPFYCNGFHFHNMCKQKNIFYIEKVLKKIKSKLGRKWYKNFKNCQMNIGGGYVFNNSNDYSSLNKIQKRNKHYSCFIVEPGYDIINSAGSLVSKVTDIFERKGQRIAILDISVNHLPEVFEYQYSPEVQDTSDNYKYSYILAGTSCLSGDIFGKYRFKNALKLGDKITFKNIGAYSLVKAHTFNGLKIPKVLLT